MRDVFIKPYSTIESKQFSPWNLKVLSMHRGGIHFPFTSPEMENCVSRCAGQQNLHPWLVRMAEERGGAGQALD